MVRSLRILVAAAALAGAFGPASAQDAAPALLPGRVVAVGIPGAGAIAQLGYMHPSDTGRDAALGPAEARRLLVGAPGGFGAARHRDDHAEGAVVSIDPHGAEPVRVPSDLGADPSVREPRARMFSGQSRAFLPRDSAPGEPPAASNPLGIVVDNGHAQISVVGNPGAADGAGLRSDHDVAGAMPADAARRPRAVRGGAVAAVLVGQSGGSGAYTIQAVLTVDGGLGQLRADGTVAPLAPPNTITPLPLLPPDQTERALVTRAGMVFNWVPDRIVYVSDPMRNTVVALRLAEDGPLFRVDGIRRIESVDMNAPVDLAPAVPENANPRFSSNTSLAGGADFYVLNRGNGVVLRLNQAGQTVASRRISVGGVVLGERTLNGIAVARDAQRLWLTVTGPLPGYPGVSGGVIEVPAFGPSRPAALTSAQQVALVEHGAALFQTAFTPEQGLGPLYNGTSCPECHQFPSLGGAGPEGLAVVYRVGRFQHGVYDPMLGAGGPMARKYSIGGGCRLVPGIPPLANLISVRNTPSLFGDGLIDQIPDAAVRARARTSPDEFGVAGRAHAVRDAAGAERVGKFGWKADTATLEQFVAEAMRNEMGLTTPLAAQDIVPIPPGCGVVASPKFDATVTRALTAFVASLPAPSPAGGRLNDEGEALFAATGCAACHTPSLPSPGRPVPLYSDLLLHDLGPALDDGVAQGQARGKDWRTTPLWGLGSRVRFLHDGRATTVSAAIAAHGGEADKSVDLYKRLTPALRDKLLAFLGSL